MVFLPLKFSNQAFVILEKAYVPGFNMFATLLVARLFGPEELGAIAFLFIFYIWGSLLISRGSDQDLQVFLASAPRAKLRQLAADHIKLRIKRFWVLGFVFLLILFLEIKFFEIGFDFTMASTGIFLGLITGIVFPNELHLIVGRKFSSLVYLKYFSGLLSFFVCLFGLFFFQGNFFVVVFFLIFERLMYLLVTIFYLGNNIFKLGKQSSRSKMPGHNIYVLASSLAVFCYNRADQLYIFAVLSKSDLGQYFLVVRVFELALLFVLAQINTNLGVLADSRQLGARAATIERNLFLFSVFICLLTLLLTPAVTNLVFKVTIENNLFLICIFGSTILACIGSIKGPWVAKNNRFQFNTACTFVGGVIAIAYLFFAEPQDKTEVALAVFIGQFIVNVGLPLFSSRERRFIFNLLHIKKS